MPPHLSCLTPFIPPQIPDHGLPCDLLWSDPSAHISGWSPNDRGVSYTFGSDVVVKFLVITLFSATNYLDMFDNSEAKMKVDEGLVFIFVMLKAARGGCVSV